MKKLFIILIIGIIFVSACSKIYLIFTIEDLNNKQLDPGIYYEYSYNDEQLKGIEFIDVNPILNSLIDNNVPVTEAWHKNYASSCCPPNTNRCMQVIVNPVFIIKLKENVELENFVKVNEPKIGSCAYTITHYEIK